MLLLLLKLKFKKLFDNSKNQKTVAQWASTCLALRKPWIPLSL